MLHNLIVHHSNMIFEIIIITTNYNNYNFNHSKRINTTLLNNKQFAFAAFA